MTAPATDPAAIARRLSPAQAMTFDKFTGLQCDGYENDEGGDCANCGGEGGYASCMEDCCPCEGGEDACDDPMCWKACDWCNGKG